MADRPTSVRYREAVESFVEFVRDFDDAAWATPVPCTPLWTAREVLSHVAGIPDDALAGRLDGVTTEPWTASQVERNASFTVDELLERLLAQYAQFGDALDLIGEHRPPFDCHSHEHDLRHALGRPGNRASALIEDAAMIMVTGVETPVSLTVGFPDGSVERGGVPGASRAVALRTTRFEVFRSKLGRRTPAQLRALEWSGDAADVDAVVSEWFSFGPSEVDIVE